MESSFCEYRDKSGVDSDSDTEIIDDSEVEESFILTSRTPLKKNHTIIPDSEESVNDEESEEEELRPQAPKPVPRRSIQETVVCSSDDGASEQNSRAQSQNMSYTNNASSSDEGEVSPELVPKRRPALRPKSLNSTAESPVVRRVKKRMMLLESDTDNSIIIEKENNRKMKCLKDTPLKIDSGKDKVNDSDESEVESDGGDDDGKDSEGEASDDEANENDEDQMAMSRATRMSIMGIIPKQNESDESDFIESDEDKTCETPGSTENLPNLSEEILTRNSALKVRTKKSSKRLDFNSERFQLYSGNTSSPIASDPRSVKRSNVGSTESLSDLPEVDLTRRLSLKPTPEKPKTPAQDPKTIAANTPEKPESGNDSVLTCSPFASPLHDKTNEIDSPVLGRKFTPRSTNDLKDKVLSKLIADDASNKENSRADDDDDVTVIDSAPEVITLSSDDEDEIKTRKKSPNIKKSPSLRKSPKPAESSTARRSKDNTIRQYLPPPSYPNQVVYVQKHVRDNELNKLNGMQADLHNIRNLLENMDVTTLPDGGSKLIMRLTELEEQVRRQGDRVGNMVVEPKQPSPADIARDGFDQGLSWDDIQKASNAVQPRMFGKQAMSTHLAERGLILERLRELHAALGSRPADAVAAAAPAALRAALMPHQLHALAWLRWRETQSPPGGILADDMGLGKTITMISLIAGDKELMDDGDDDDDDDERPRQKLVKGSTLVVCPASLMTQWEAEVQKHCVPHRVSTCLHHGAARATQPQRLHHDIVLTTYNILQRDSEKNGVLMRIQWRRVILDEGHIVRNHKSATSLAVCALRARRRWVLTGTPVHNKDLDLFALLKFLRCTPFDELTMWKKWIDNKSAGGQERLSTIMRCIMLRRTKAQLQARGELSGLPTREAHSQLVTLTKEEMNVYQKVLVFSKTLFAQFLHQRAEKQADSVGFLPKGKDSAYDKMHKKMIALQGAKPVKSHEILVLLLRLRQVCCHCGLIAAMLDPEDAGAVEDEGGKDLLAELNKLSLEDASSRRKSGDKEQEEEPAPEQEGTTAAEAIRSVLSPNNPVFELANRSSKIQAVMDCLKERVLGNKGEKAIVVSQWTSVLRLVEGELKEEGVRCVTLSGSVPVPARAALVQALNNPHSDVRIMLLSLCAGGVGLNLCGANHLLLLDPHWNPQLEQQAQDRVYRVGQTRPVHIYRFMCVDTVEQSIRKLQDAKLQLADSVLTGARAAHASKLSIEDLKLLFNMGPAPAH